MNEKIKKYMFEKELKTEFRSIRYILSIIFVNIILFVCIAYYYNMVFSKTNAGYSTDYKLILGMYNVLLLIEYIIILCVIPFIATSTIGREYETKTIDLLLLTDMKTSDIINIKFKKLVVTGAVLVISTLPLLSIVFSVSEVNIINLLMFVIVILSSVMCYGSIGMYIATKTKKVTTSALITCVVELVSTLGSYVIIGSLFKMLDSIFKGNIKHLGDILLFNPLISIFKIQSYVEGSSSTYRMLMNDLGVFRIIDVLWIPLSVGVQLVVTIVVLSIIKNIMKRRHYK